MEHIVKRHKGTFSQFAKLKAFDFYVISVLFVE